MKPQTAILVIRAALVLLSGFALAQSEGQPPSSPYAVEPGTMSGAGYQLTGLTWQVSGTATGATYRLDWVGSPELRGSGCCCTYVPLAVRNF
jgi:hypothetical protein